MAPLVVGRVVRSCSGETHHSPRCKRPGDSAWLWVGARHPCEEDEARARGFAFPLSKSTIINLQGRVCSRVRPVELVNCAAIQASASECQIHRQVTRSSRPPVARVAANPARHAHGLAGVRAHLGRRVGAVPWFGESLFPTKSVPQSLPQPVSNGRPSHRTRRFPPSGVAHQVSARFMWPCLWTRCTKPPRSRGTNPTSRRCPWCSTWSSCGPRVASGVVGLQTVGLSCPPAMQRN